MNPGAFSFSGALSLHESESEIRSSHLRSRGAGNPGSACRYFSEEVLRGLGERPAAQAEQIWAGRDLSPDELRLRPSRSAVGRRARQRARRRRAGLRRGRREEVRTAARPPGAAGVAGRARRADRGLRQQRAWHGDQGDRRRLSHGDQAGISRCGAGICEEPEAADEALSFRPWRRWR